MFGWDWGKRFWSKSLLKRTGSRLREHWFLVEDRGSVPRQLERKSSVCYLIDPKQSALFVSYLKSMKFPGLKSSCCAGFRMERGHGKTSCASNGTSAPLKPSRDVKSTMLTLPRLLRWS
jgi:hypothetical protein